MRNYLDIPYRNTDDPAYYLDIHLPEEGNRFPVFVYFHGGGLVHGAQRMKPLWPQYLTDRGIAVVSANYRLYPQARYPDYLEDAAAAVAWVKENFSCYAEVESIYIGGSSAGGYLSMMLCFDETWLGKHGILPTDIGGFGHDAGQPTCHFQILTQEGRSPKQIVVNEKAPLYHVGKAEAYPPMQFIVATEDMKNRYEETMLMISALENFGYSRDGIRLKVMESQHCKYVNRKDESGESIFGQIVFDFIKSTKPVPPAPGT